MRMHPHASAYVLADLIREFYTHSFTIFSSLQSIAAAQASQSKPADAAWLAAGPSVQTMQYYHRIGTLYCEAIQSYMRALESPQSEETEYERHVQ